jgi:hypothetical protein
VEENIVGGLAGIAAAFVAGAVFGRVAGTDSRAIGDRVMSGLIAIPLISLAVNKAFPEAGIGWAIAAPVPLVIYLFLLYGSDPKFPLPRLQQSISDRFVLLLVLSVGAFYTVIAAVILALH